MPSPTRQWVAAPLAIAAALLVSAPVVAAQSAPGTAELRQLAQDLADALPDADLRVAVVPITDGPMPTATEVLPEITDHLRSALTIASRGSDRTIAIVEPTEVSEAIRELQIPQALSAGGALLVGVFVDADYVVSGTWQRLDAGAPGLLSVELLDVKTRRARRTASATLRRTAADPIAASTQRAVVADTPRSSTGSRGVVLSSGFVGAALAAVLAVSKERELRMSRSRLLELPAGASAEWDSEFQHAADLQRTRNLWLGAAIGAGGATLAYMLLSGAADDDPGPRALRVPIPGHWTVGLHPIAPGFALSAAF